MTGERELTKNVATRLVRVLKRLPRRQRHVFVLHRFEGWECVRIAAHMRITSGKVEDALAAAVLALCEADEAKGAKGRNSKRNRG